jgi:glycosyltransferase involved in cell wall biosynthesis
MSTLCDVLVPCFNDYEGVLRCLSSLRDQTLQPDKFKIIIVDDGSDEPLVSTKVPSLFEDLNITLVTHQENRGLPTALNTALENSTSRYFVRIDSDDYVHKSFLEVLLLAFENDASLAAVATDYKVVDEYENLISIGRAKDYPIGCAVMFRRTILNEIGMYDTNMLLAEEIEFMQRFKARFELKHVEIALYRYTQRSGSLTSNKELYEAYKEKARSLLK